MIRNDTFGNLTNLVGLYVIVPLCAPGNGINTFANQSYTLLPSLLPVNRFLNSNKITHFELDAFSGIAKLATL